MANKRNDESPDKAAEALLRIAVAYKAASDPAFAALTEGVRTLREKAIDFEVTWSGANQNGANDG